MSADHPQIKELEYDYIADGIYIGTNQCCEGHFDERLRKEGIGADVSLEEDRVDAPFGVLFYVWIPVKDHEAPSEEQLAFGVSALETLVKMKKKVYVHCRNGHGRSPTLVAAYLVRQGKSVAEAIAFVKSRRPAIHLEETQKRALEEFSKNSVRSSCCLP